MKNFRTVVTPEKSPFSITHRDSIVSIGSCFSENIGKKFSEYKFQININPFGQQYNPYSIACAIERLLNGELYSENDLVFHDELFHSFDHHGSFSKSSVAETLQTINENFTCASADLKNANILFLTFGTSHVFSLKTTGKIVSNCHKLSGNNFERRLLAPHEIFDLLNDTLLRLRKVNSEIKIVLTVSPVRYFAFGHHENTVSKSHLFAAIHQLQKAHSGYFYFSAYELVMDDLRDYRFFAEDMLHPNYQATDYVWEKLCDSMIDKKTLQAMKEIDEILSAVKHRPRNANSEAHKTFVKKTLQKIEKLKNEMELSFTEEEKILNAYL
jgi:hypothetical protein